jgi:hypothetical protein
MVNTARHLAQGLEFITRFISATNPDGARSIATWTLGGILVGGTPKRAGLVRGLPAPAVPLSFRKGTARATAAFLAQIRGDVEIRVEGARYTFTCPSAGHVLSVPQEAAHFPDYLMRFFDEECETIIVDRKAFLASVEILSVFLPTRGHSLDLRVRGVGPHASVLLSTPEAEPGRSTDEFAIIRRGGESHHVSVVPDTNAATSVPDTSFPIPSDGLREALCALEVITLDCRYNRRERRIIIEAAPVEGIGSRAVVLSVGSHTPVQAEFALPMASVNDRAEEPRRSLSQEALN